VDGVIEPPIFGREAALVEIEGFLAARDRLPSALLIEGEAGIGKTTLWQHGVLDGRIRGFEVLSGPIS
jgi:hypothetical protein